MTGQPISDPDVQALTEALSEALASRDGAIGWAGSYDHGAPPSAEQIVRSMLPRLGRKGYALVPVENGTPQPPPHDLVGFALAVTDFCNDPQLVRAAQAILTAAGATASAQS